MTVNLSQATPPIVFIDYLTGQGRAAGDVRADTPSCNLFEGINSTGSEVRIPLPQPVYVLLDGYTQNMQAMDIVGLASPNSAFFQTIELVVPSVDVEDSSGNFGSPFTGPGGQFLVDFSMGSQIPAFPGRTTNVPIYLDDAEIWFDGTGYSFNTTLFVQNNTSPGNPYIQGLFSDYVMFDISSVANPPHLADPATNLLSATPAKRVYFSGEDRRYASSPAVGTGPTTDFTIYTPGGNLTGLFSPPSANNPNGTYTVQEFDPRDLTNTAKITSWQGIWRPVTSMINNLTTFDVILFPHAADDNTQDMVVLVRNSAGSITNMYFGLADLSGDTFAVYPIANMDYGTTVGELDGSFSALKDTNGGATTTPANVRAGTFTFTTGALPTGFQTTGQFVVYRA
jgi:hypothetical protein